jgi:hypothetical protein
MSSVGHFLLYRPPRWAAAIIFGAILAHYIGSFLEIKSICSRA